MKRFLFAAMLICSSAHASDFYVYGALGIHSNMHIDKVQRDAATASIFGNNTDDSFVTENDGNAGKLQLGYRISRYLAVEGGYMDLGQAHYFARRTEHPAPLVTNVFTSQEEWSAHGYNVAAVGFMPLGDHFSLLAKVGAVNAKMHFKRDANLNGTPSEADTSVTSWAPNFGVGADLSIPGSLPIGLRAELERVSRVGDDSTAGKRNIDIFSIGVVVKF